VEVMGESKSGRDEPSEMVPETTSDSGSGSYGLFAHQIAADLSISH